MSTLVTGGAGFLGSYLLRHLRERFPGKKLFNLGLRDPGMEGVEHLQCDLTDEPRLLQVLRPVRPERLYHLAGMARVSGEIPFPDYFSGNFLTTAHLLRALKTVGAPARFFFASSVHVYGNQQEVATEMSPPRPRNAHGFSKYLAEEALRASVRDGFARVVVGRLYNCIGPGQPEGFVAADLCRRLARLPEDGSVPLKTGPLSPVRRFLDVRDAVRLLVSLLEAESASPFEIYNIASPYELTIGDLVSLLLREAGRKVPVQGASDPLPHQFAGVRLSLEKLERAIGPLSFRPIEATLREMWREAQTGAARPRPG